MNSFFQKYQVEGNVPEQDEIEQSRMSAVQGLVEQGITNPEEIMNYLNYDEEGNEVGDFTMEEVQQYLEAVSNQELPEYQSPYQEEENTESEEESADEETKGEEEEMKYGGFFKKYAVGGTENTSEPLNPQRGYTAYFNYQPKSVADYGDFAKDVKYPGYFKRDNEYFKLEKADTSGGYGMYSVPDPSKPITAPAPQPVAQPKPIAQPKKSFPTDWQTIDYGRYNRDQANPEFEVKQQWHPTLGMQYYSKPKDPQYWDKQMGRTIEKKYGGNAPGGSHVNTKIKFKKGGNTYGQGTDTYLNEMRDGFMTGMNELVTNARIQNQLKALGLPNNALKMGGSSKPKYQYYGNVNKGIRAQYPIPGYTWEQWGNLSDDEKQQIKNKLQQEYYGYNYPYGYGYPPRPYNPQLGWEGLGMNMDQRGATPADIFAAFPGLGESFAQGKNKKLGWKRSMFGLGPVKSGYVEWDGGYQPGSTMPASGESAYYDFSGKRRPRFREATAAGQEFKKGMKMIGEELADRLNLKGYQKTTPKQQEPEMGDIRNINTRPIMTALGRTFDPLRADLGARRLTVKQQSKKHGGAHYPMFQMTGENQPYGYDPSQDEAFAEQPIAPAYTTSPGYDPLGIGESAGNLADQARQTIDPAGPLGEETEPFPQQYKYRADWSYSDPEGEVRRTLGRMSKWTQRLNAQDAARKAQYNLKTSTAHNAGFGFIPQGVSGQKGSYTPNTLTVDFRPTEYTPTQFTGAALRTPSRLGSRFQGYNMFAQTGGQSFSNMDDYESDYEVGTEHFLTDDEIARIQEMGGQVQILD